MTTTTTNVLPGTGNGEIAFIDTSIAGYQTLLDGLREDVEAVLIDGAHDGLAQIAAALAGRSGIEAVHVFTHGAPGVLQLGATRLDEAGLAGYEADLGVLRSALADGADLLLYGCDVAAGAVGESFLQALSAATGADVAASIDPSGSALLGGDWELEANTGNIEAYFALAPQGQVSFSGLLAIGDQSFTGIGTKPYGKVFEVIEGGWKFTSPVAIEMAVHEGDSGVGSSMQLAGGSSNGIMWLNYSGLDDNGNPIDARNFTMSSADGSNFKLESFRIGQYVGDPSLPTSPTLTISAYRDGVLVVPAEAVDLRSNDNTGNIQYTFSGGVDGYDRYGILRFNATSTYDNIDEIRFTFNGITDLQLDDIDVSTSVADTTAPQVSEVSVPPNKTYILGEKLSFTVTFDENLTVTGNSSTLSLDIDGVARTATYETKGVDSITYSYTVQAGDLDANGITINGLSLGASTIRDAAGNPADLTLKNVGATVGVRVDGVAPAITGTITPPNNGTYAAGSNLDFTVTFDDNVTITGTNSTLELTIGTTPVFATHLSQTANSITYRYIVQAGNLDTDGIAIRGLTLPNGNTIRDAAGNNADVSLAGHLPSLGGVRVDAVAPAVLGNITAPTAGSYRASEVLSFTITFNENVTVTGADSTLGLDIGGVARSATFLSSSANSITYTYTVQAGDNDANGITVGAITLGATTIRDAAGNNAVLSLTGHLPSTAAVLVDTTAPTVAGNVAVPANATYVAGQQLDFTVTFNENVTVSGNDSTLGLTVGSTARSAVFLSANGNSITYRYAVQAGDLDANGIEVGAIALGSSTVRDAAGNNANLSLSGHVPSTSGILVDGTVPAVSGAISVPGDGMYSVGQVLEFTVTFDENVNVSGSASTLGLDIGGAARSAVYDSKTANSITYIYIVQNGDNDADGIAVTGLALNGITIRDAAGNNANLALGGHVPSLAGVLVDGGPPSVAGNIAVPAADSYRAGEVLRFTITFDENVTVSGADSTLGLDIGGVAHNAIYDSKTANSITYVYTVQAGDNDANGITVGAITLGATTIRDAAGNNAVLSLTGHLPPTAAILVDTTAPAVSGNVAVPANATYVAGQQLDFTVTFDENVTVSGSGSTLGLTVGSTARSAVFLSANGNSITYRYIVQAGDLDANGIEVGAIGLGSSTIRDAAGNNANLSLSGHLPPTSGILVDGTVPAVSGAISVPGDGMYSVGQVLEFTVTFDENVNVTGTASTLGLDIGGAARSAIYDSKTANSITYIYIVQNGDNDADGIAVTGLALNGGTIRDAAGNNANLALGGHVPSLAGVLVDGGPPSVAGNIAVPAADSYRAGEVLSFTITFDENATVSGADSTLGLDIGGMAHNAIYDSKTANSITYVYTVQAGDNDANGIMVGAITLGATTIRDAAGNDAVLSLTAHLPSTAAVLVDTTAPAVAGTVTVPLPGTYVAGQSLDFMVSFDENVTVTGNDSTLGLTIGTATGKAAFVSAAGNTVIYRYIVQTGDLDANGIDVSAIALGTSTIRDAAGNDAVIELAGHVPPTSAILVDGTVPVVSSTIAAPADKTYKVGDELVFTVTFNENVTVTGATSTLGLDIGGTVRSAVYDSKTANSITYVYTVQAGDNDANGIDITGLALNGGTIRDAAGNNANLALAGHLPQLGDVRVDTKGPAFTTATVNGNSMVLSFNDTGPLDAAHPPALEDFEVMVAGQSVTVTGLTINASAKTVTLTLSTAVTNGQAVTVAYDDLTPNDASAIQDAVGNHAASIEVTPVVNNTPAPPTNPPTNPPIDPPTNPPTTGNTVDGVTLQIGTVVRSDGAVAQVVTVPIVTPSRQEQVGNNNVADIPLVKAADGSSLLAVQVPTGAGLQSIGNGAPKRAGDSLTDLIREIQAHTTNGSDDQNQLTGGGGGFLGILDADTPLLVQTIVLSGNGGTAGAPLGIIGQPQQADAVQSALVIDARSLSSGATIELQHASFAAIIGAASVTGGAGNQHVWGDSASQTIILGEGDDVLHGGAGDDVIGSGAGDDMIHGDEGNDLVFGGEGNDYLDGGAGHDTARFSGAVDGYSLRLKDGLLVMTDRLGSDGIDTVATVEVLRFTGGQSMAADAVLARLYDGVLGRQASAAEVAWWQDVHVRGASLQQIAAAIIDSPEAAQALGRADDDAFVAGLYQSVLGRTAPAAERAFWNGRLADGIDRAAVALGFVNSAEKLASSLDVDFNHSDVAVMARMYHALFGRAPDEAGLNFWLGRHEDGVSLGDIADAFVVSTEAQGLAGHGSDAAFIDQLFATALDRAPSSGEKTLLLEQLQNGVHDRGQVLLAVSESDESIVIVGVINTSIDLI
jgi:uncharacterized repeat protein (TIGR02059 family)